MVTEWICKAALTAFVVWLVMRVADRCGPRLGGVTAALPTVTAPTLLWVAHEQGPRFAAGAAIGSVAACAVLAAFALTYALIARRRGCAVALLAGIAAVAATTVPALAVSASLGLSLLCAVAAAMLASAAMQRHAVTLAAKPAPTEKSAACALERACVAVIVGATTALVAAIGPAFGDYATGLLASLPLIGGAVAVLEQSRGGAHAATEFLRGYVAGLFARAAFGTTFALTAPALGAVAGLVLAFAAAVALSASARHPAVEAARRCWLARTSRASGTSGASRASGASGAS